MKVENMINSRGNTIANQFLLYNGVGVTFQSYKSKIAEYEPQRLYLIGSMWDYSVTTRRYFKQFINEETPFTYENKVQWEKEIKSNDDIEVV